MSNEIFSSEFWEQKLLKHMQILNQTDLIKHTPTSNRHKSLQNFRVVVGNCHSKTREIQQKSVSKTSIIKVRVLCCPVLLLSCVKSWSWLCAVLLTGFFRADFAFKRVLFTEMIPVLSLLFTS